MQSALQVGSSIHFLDDAEPSNLVLVGSNGVGKTMIARNLAHQAVLRGKSVRFVSASETLNELASQDGSEPQPPR